MTYKVCCGGRGIRTPGGVTLNSFQDCRIRPLCHSSNNGCKYRMVLLAHKKIILKKYFLIPSTRCLWHRLGLSFFRVQYCKSSNSGQRCIFPHFLYRLFSGYSCFLLHNYCMLIFLLTVLSDCR